MEMRFAKWVAVFVAAAIAMLCGTARADIVRWEDENGKTRTDMRAVVDWGDSVVDGGFVLTVTPAPGEPQVAIAISKVKTIVFQNDDGVAGRDFGVTLRDANDARSSFPTVRLLNYADGVFTAEPFDRGKRSTFLGTEADSFQGTALNFSGGERPEDSPAGPLDDVIGGAIQMDAAAQQELLDKISRIEEETKAGGKGKAAKPRNYADEPAAEGGVALEEGEDAEAGTSYGEDIQVDEESGPSIGNFATAGAFGILMIAILAVAAVEFIVGIFLAIDAFREGEVLLGIGNLCCFPVRLYYAWARYEGGGKTFVRVIVTVGFACNLVGSVAKAIGGSF